MPALYLSARRARLAVAAAGAACVPLILAGCSGAVTVTSTSTAAAAKAGPIASATIPTPSATLAGGASAPVAPPTSGTGVPGKDVADAIRGALSSAKTVRITMTNQAGSGTAVVDLEHKALRLTADGANPVTLVHLDGRTWVRGAGTVTLTAQPTPTGTVTPRATRSTRSWLLLDPQGADVLSRKLGSAVDVASMLRPDAFTSMFDGLTGDRTSAGDGTRTSFWVPPPAYVAAVRGGADLAAAITGPATVVVELDSSNRLMRLTATMPAGKATVVDDTRYSGWDEPVRIEAPDPAEVGPAPLPEGRVTADPAPSRATRTSGATATSTPTP